MRESYLRQVAQDMAPQQYSSEAEGRLEIRPDGMAFTSFTVRLRIVVASQHEAEAAEEAVRKAADACLISRSLGAQVEVQPQISVA